MNDCSNAEMRDRLPDLMHGRLEVRVRAAVAAHLADCADCREELALLRGVHGVLIMRAPAVDVSRIVAALPKPSSRPTRVAPTRSRWMDWRVAAAVTLLAAGGGSVAIIARTPRIGSERVSIGAPAQPSGSAVGTAPVAGSPARSASTASETTLAAVDDPAASTAASADERLDELNEGQLKTLLDQIDQLEAIPVTDPEPVTIHVNSGTSLSPEGT
jgi:anti-sigma factor RsiW